MGAVYNMPYLHHSNPLATLWGIAGRSRRGDPEPTTGRMCKVILWVHKRCKGVAERYGPLLLMGCSGAVRHRMQLGCSAALAQMQRGLHWHAHGSHVPQGTQGTQHSCPYLVYSYFVLELGRNGYGYLGRYPLVKLLGSIVPFTGCHPISLLFIYEFVDW